MEDKTKKLIEYISQSSNIVFFGGAGVSTESGIPDFRSKDGLYNQHDIKFDKYKPEYLLSKECLYHNPKVFYEFYRQKMNIGEIQPNITHEVLAKLEKVGKLKAVITQNIDGLHQKAGSKNVCEIHGTTQRNYCVKCKKEFDKNYIFNSNELLPKCQECRSPIRPDIVLYGESLPREAVNKAKDFIKSADMLIIGGTSLSVHPAAQFVYSFFGEHLVIINREELKIKLNKDSDIMICNSLGKVFWEINEVLDKLQVKDCSTYKNNVEFPPPYT